ncbi:MAG TPA: YtcA family lipoprotein [Acidobacteriaceae bacterium]|nr:YtcA family lipoprotein [Acidobacteriaceae bacterium]
MTENLPSPLTRVIGRPALGGASFVLTALAAGCSRAPTFNILGSFFPSWILCGLLGIILASLVRLFFLRIKLEGHLLWPLVLVYPCLTLFFTFTIWLLFFS